MNLKKVFALYLSFLLMSIVAIGSFGESAEAASSRTAKIDSVIGTVTIQKAGGQLTLRAYEGMLIEQGDRITTNGEFSSVKLIFPDTQDEILIDSHSDVVFTDLRIEAGNHLTRVTVKSGSGLSSVTPFKNKADIFEVNTPGHTMSAKGTNFFIGVNPITGEPSLAVFSGIVNVNLESGTTHDFNIYPGQQLTMTPDQMTHIPPIDNQILSQMLQTSTPAVLEAILNSTKKIIAENEEFRNKFDAPYGNENELHPEQYIDNVYNLILALSREALKRDLVSQDLLREVIKDAQNSLLNEDTGRNSELDSIREEELRKRLEKEEAKKRELAEAKQRMEETARNLIESRRILQEQQKNKLEEAKRKKAEELFKEQLNEAEKARLLKDIQNRSDEIARQNEARDEAQKKSEPTPAPPELSEPILDEPSEPAEPSEPTPTPKPEPSEPTIDERLAEAKANAPKEQGGYTDESWKALAEAMEMSEESDEDKVAKKNAIWEAISGLVEMEKPIEPTIDEQLAEAKANAPKNQDRYTDESWKALRIALNMSEESDAEKIAKTNAIWEAIERLVEVEEPITSTIDEELAEAKANAPENQGSYTDESWKALRIALGMSEESDAEKIAKKNAIWEAIERLLEVEI